MSSVFNFAIHSMFVIFAATAAASETPTGKLRYFGFALIDCTVDDPHDRQQKSNYIDEVAGFTNIGQLCVFTPEDPLPARLEAFQAAGVKAILYIEAIFFESHPDASQLSGERLRLRADAAQRWKAFSKLNKRQLTAKYIAAIQMVDEPVWRGLQLADFTKALRMVKADYPALPLASVEAHPVLNKAVIPPELDWIGFDRYNPKNPEDDAEWLADFETLKNARSRKSQKYFIVANTQWLPSFGTDGGIIPKDMGPINIGYYNIARSTPDVVALIGYAWPGGLDGMEQLGARSLPKSVKATLKHIGHSILGKKQ